MFICITDNFIYKNKSLDKLNKKNNFRFDLQDFKVVGSDYIINCTNKDIEFIQDKNSLYNASLSSLFRKDNSNKFILIFILLLNIVVLLSNCTNQSNNNNIENEVVQEKSVNSFFE